MIVAFTGLGHGQSRVTANLVASASALAVDHHMRILMTHSQIEFSTINQAYSQQIGIRKVNDPNRGMSGLHRLISCGSLDASSIRDNADNILKDRLDLLYGSPLDTLNEQDLKQCASYVLDHYRRDYDLLFIDVNSGYHSEITQLILNRADLVIVNFSQNSFLLDTSLFTITEQLGRKNLAYCIGAYDHRSNLTKDKLSKDYGINKKVLGAIPYNTDFMNALNKHNLMDYILRIRSTKKKFLSYNEDYEFIDGIRDMNSIILQALGLRPLSEEEAYD